VERRGGRGGESRGRAKSPSEGTRSENGGLPVAPARPVNLASPPPPPPPLPPPPPPPLLIHLEGPSVDDSRISRCSRYHRYARISDFRAPRNATRSRSCLFPPSPSSFSPPPPPPLSLSLSLYRGRDRHTSVHPIQRNSSYYKFFSFFISIRVSPGLRFFYKGHSDTGQEALTILSFFSPPPSSEGPS